MSVLEKINSKSRFVKIAYSSIASIVFKVITFLFTFILTRLIIVNYGSEINGMISSITQYLGLIVLLEGGIGSVARAVLYKPLAKKDTLAVQKIIAYLEKFFRLLAIVFIIYAIAIAAIFPCFDSSYNYLFTLSLVLVISLSIFCEYFFGMAYSILLAADQKVYLVNTVTFVSLLLNFVFSLVLILFKCPIHIVKLISAFALMIRPIFLSFYCKRKYKIQNIKLSKRENLIPNKWVGLGTHIAFYLHRNTDIFLITIFLGFTTVSVYSVYNMIIGGILTIIGTLSIGIEAAFGNMYANEEFENLKSRFRIYVTYYQILCSFLLSCSLILIIPFVKIYTSGVIDINYIQPVFAIVFIVSEFIYCLRVPFNDLMIATDSFKKTQMAAYIETVINITLSVILILFLNILGVVIATAIAMIFRVIHYLIFFKLHKIKLEISWFFRLTLCSFMVMLVSFGLSFLLNFHCGATYLSWVLYAIKICVLVAIIAFIFYHVFCWKLISELRNYLSTKFKIKNGGKS